MDNTPYPNIIPPDRRDTTANPAFSRQGYPAGIADVEAGGSRTAGGGGRNQGGYNTNMSENRNFPQNSQATLPQQYQHFSAFAPPPSTDLQSLNASQQSRILPPGIPYSSYNAPHFRSSPHGYPEAMQQLSSPITPHRYDYPSHSYQSNANEGMASEGQGQGGGLPTFQYAGNSKRRESMPDMTNRQLFSNRLMMGGPQHNTFIGNNNGNGNGLQQYVHSLTGLVQTSPTQATPSSLGLRTWQPIPPVQPQPSTTSSTPSSAHKRKRSRASTFGSRTTDEETSQNPASVPLNSSTSANSLAEGSSSRPTTAENAIGNESQPAVSAKDFSEQTGKKAVKNENSDEIVDMDEEHEQEVDEKIDHRKRKRNRTIRSCVPCHNHKRRCDRKRPCGRCTALGLTGTCVYEIDEARDMNDPDVVETERLRRRIAELEQVVRELRQKAPTRAQAQPAAIANTPSSSSAVLEETPGEDKKRMVIVDRFARFKLVEAKDVENSAAAAGSRSITPNPPAWAPQTVINSRSGGIRTNIHTSASDDQLAQLASNSGNTDYKSEPYQTYLLPGEEMSSDKTGRKVFLGVSTGKSMLRRLREIAKDKGDGQLLSVPEDVAFTGVFPDLRKTYPFTTIWSHESFSAEIIGLLPNMEQAELLWKAWEEEHAVYFHPFHMPTIYAEYTSFFAMVTKDKMNVPLSSLALYLIICALGCVIRATTAELFGHPDPSIARQGNFKKSTSKDHKDLTSSRLQSELYLSASFQALRLCAFLANPTMRTIQAQLLQMVYLLASERAADAWTSAGTLAKQAIALGLHKDPLSLDPKISMRDAECRRRLWWSIAGFDCMLCIFFGRPSTISYYSTNLPQDRPDANLSEQPGSAQQFLPPSNVLSNETTEQTYHAAYYQLTIPSFELLDRIFTVDRRDSRSTIYGWFSPPPKDNDTSSTNVSHVEENQHTYQGALRLAQDIIQWYSHLPPGIKFNENDTPEHLLGTRNRRQLNQTLILSMKTWTIVMVLHRPYLRLDPTAYPESTEICSQAAHLLLKTYKAMADTKSTLAWSFWTMPYRAFQAGAVCAFLSIRQPGTELADKCLDGLRGVIRVFEDRLSTWNVTHPVQADLCQGLVQLEKLVTAATQQRGTPQQSASTSTHSTLSSASPNLFGMSPNSFSDSSFMTPLSLIQGFPPVSVPNPSNAAGNGTFLTPPSTHLSHGNQGHSGEQRNDRGLGVSMTGHVNDYNGEQPLNPIPINGDFNGPGPLALPQFWANMFGIRMEKEKEASSFTNNNGMNANSNGSGNW